MIWTLVTFSSFTHENIFLNPKNFDLYISLIYTQSVIGGKSVWYPGPRRKEWKRPCFAEHHIIVMGDSQLKIYGKDKIKKKGYNITSYSGADVSIL